MQAPAADGQQEVFRFFQSDERFVRAGPVTRIDTHGAVVFLAGVDAFKIKRDVRYSFMDFSTLEKRRAACEAEIAVNRDNAPDIYVGTLPVVRRDGTLHLGGAGEIVEWAVHLKRFDETATFDRLAAGGGLDAAQMDLLAQAIGAAHRRAPIAARTSFATRLHGYLLDIAGDLVEQGDLWPKRQAEDLRVRLDSSFASCAALLERREGLGFVRRCHGDLHLGNIVRIDGRPVLFDAIEFDDMLATIDVFYDLAFVLMDLWERRAHALANRLFNRYLTGAVDFEAQAEGLALLPLFMALRAAIRARVTAAAFRLDPSAAALRAKAVGYFATACAFIESPAPVLVAIGGLSGTGKSALAVALAPFVGRPPGAVVLRSDVERKKRLGVEETQRLPSTAYSREAGAALYERLRGMAAATLRAGQAAVLDATHLEPAARRATEAVAAAAGAPFLGLWLEAPLDTLLARVAARRGDASDATPSVVASQAEADIGALTWPILAADLPLEANLSAARRLAGGAVRQAPTQDEASA